MRVCQRLSAFVAVVSMSLCFAGIAQAQTTGSIFGIVQDESEAVIPGATVTIRNVDTGLTRSTVTDADGRYEVLSLPPGSYEIQAELAGFQTAVRRGVVLTVGREAQVNFTVRVGDVAETLVVTGEAPLVETTSAAMSQVVDSKQIRDLPLNARDFVQLATLQPGVSIVDTGAKVDEGGASGAAGRGLGVKLTISGARTNSNAFLLDGTDVNDYSNTTPGSITGANLGVEAIREFRVLTNTYSAEYGRSAGGVVVAVSRSGTNEFHGSAFEFHRNSEMDAANFFDKSTGREKPEFRRNQFGGAVGGPVLKNKLFFFGNYEGQRSTAGSTEIATVMTPAARQGNLSAALGGAVVVDPAIRPILDLFPLPNGAIRAGGDVGDYVSTTKAEIQEDFFVVKVDHQLSNKHNYFVRHTYSDASNIRPNNLQVSTIDAGSERQYTTFDWKTIFTSTLLNSATFAVNRTDVFNGRLTPLINVPSLSFIQGRPMGFVDVSGITSFPGDVGGSDEDLFNYTVFQIRDDITWSRGSHGLKFGFNIERIHLDMDSTSNINGGFGFGSIRDFLLNRPNSFAGTVPGSDAARRYRQGLYGFYVQDDFRLSPRLTLNGGLRYEFISEISELDGKLGALVNFTDAKFTVGKLFENPSLKNFAPRIGFAWDPAGNGMTAIRGGFGIFHDQVLTHYFSGGTGVRNPPHFVRITFGTDVIAPGDFPFGAYPKLLAFSQGGITTAEWFEYRPDQPTAMQFNLNVQRQLPGNLVVMAGYVGYRAQNLKRTAQDGNLRVPVVLPDGRLFFNHAGKNPCPIAACFDTPRQNPNFLLMRTAALDGESFYHALQLGMNKRFQQGLQFQASYSFGKSIDDSSGVFNESDLGNSNLYPYFPDPRFNRGLSDFDVRHTLMINYTYDLPFHPSGVVGAILGGWQSSGILRASAGQPYTVVLGSDQAQTLSARGSGGQRPSVPEGHDGKIESTGDPTGWFDRTQFIFPEAGFLGNLGRGTGTGDGLLTFDTTLSKNIYFSGSRYLQFRADLFNALNGTNFSNPGRPAVFDRQGRINPSAGRLTSTSTRNRQLQLSLKFYF
jgi:hypothetical protein